MRRYAVLRTAAVLAAVTANGAAAARAQGFGVYEHDACVMARAGTAVASPCSGGSAIFFNPAGIIGGSLKWNAQFGATVIAPRGSFTDSATQVTTDAVKNNIPVPTGYLTRQINSRWAVGFGVNVPYGLVQEWPNTFSGRFLAYKAELRTVYFQPTVAYAISPRVSVGAGVDIVRGSATVHQRLDLSQQVATGTTTFAALGIPVGTDFADATLDVSGTGYGAHLGFLAKPWDWLSVGGRVLTSVSIDYTGTAAFTRFPTGIALPAGNAFGVPNGTPLDSVVSPVFSCTVSTTPCKLYSGQGVRTTITNPEQIVVGAAVRPWRGVTVLFDYQYVNWKRFDILPFDLDSAGSQTLHEDYRPTSGFRGGVELAPSSRITLRGGLLFHQAAAPSQTVTPLLPEGQRIEGTAGVGLGLSSQVRLDLAYQYIRQQDRRGRVVDTPAGTVPTDALSSGLYRSIGKLYGASLSFAF